MKFGRLHKTQGSGAPARFAYLALLRHVTYFPATDTRGVQLQGDIVMLEGHGMTPVYLSNSSQEYSYETIGEDDGLAFKVSFNGTHPGTGLEALEFAQNNLGEEFIVIIPGCDGEETKVLGTPCAPLVFTSKHKASKDGQRFDFVLEQQYGSPKVYQLYSGQLQLQEDSSLPGIGTGAYYNTGATWEQTPAGQVRFDVNDDMEIVMHYVSEEALFELNDNGELETDMAMFVTRAEVQEMLKDTAPNNVYTKEEINDKFDALNASLPAPDSQVYTVADIDTKLDNLTDMFTEALATKQDKP